MKVIAASKSEAAIIVCSLSLYGHSITRSCNALVIPLLAYRMSGLLVGTVCTTMSLKCSQNMSGELLVPFYPYVELLDKSNGMLCVSVCMSRASSSQWKG
jgi:hypothetical protein